MTPAEIIPWVTLGTALYNSVQYMVDNIRKRRDARRAKRKRATNGK